jgi:hypothetical protein
MNPGGAPTEGRGNPVHLALWLIEMAESVLPRPPHTMPEVRAARQAIICAQKWLYAALEEGPSEDAQPEVSAGKRAPRR